MRRWSAKTIGISGRVVRLELPATRFRSARIVYASWSGRRWILPSGRTATDRMLDAIDELMITIEEE